MVTMGRLSTILLVLVFSIGCLIPSETAYAHPQDNSSNHLQTVLNFLAQIKQRVEDLKAPFFEDENFDPSRRNFLASSGAVAAGVATGGIGIATTALNQGISKEYLRQLARRRLFNSMGQPQYLGLNGLEKYKAILQREAQSTLNSKTKSILTKKIQLANQKIEYLDSALGHIHEPASGNIADYPSIEELKRNPFRIRRWQNRINQNKTSARKNSLIYGSILFDLVTAETLFGERMRRHLLVQYHLTNPEKGEFVIALSKEEEQITFAYLDLLHILAIRIEEMPMVYPQVHSPKNWVAEKIQFIETTLEYLERSKKHLSCAHITSRSF